MKTPETSKKSSNSTRKTKLAALGVGIVFAFVLLEVMTRLLLFVNPDLISFEEQDKEFLVENPYWKIWHYPNNQVRHQRACFDVNYSTNSWGMKSDEVDTSKFSIALIGDSYIEGYGEDNETSMAHYLDSLTGEDTEILNFGTSGGFGTVHQYALYENFARYFKPDVVVLFFLSYNDLYDNVNAIAEGLIDDKFNYTFERTSGLADVEQMLNALPEPQQRETRKGWFVSLKLIGKGLKSLEVAVQYMLNTRVELKGALGEVLNPEQSETLDKGYEIFRQSLSDIKMAVERDGSQFALVQIPTPYQVDDNWLNINGRKLDADLQPDLPNQKVNAISKELGIEVLDLLPAAQSYIEREEISYPYLYHSCDAHMSAEGNLWFAEQVKNYLESKGLLNNGIY